MGPSPPQLSCLSVSLSLSPSPSPSLSYLPPQFIPLPHPALPPVCRCMYPTSPSFLPSLLPLSSLPPSRPPTHPPSPLPAPSHLGSELDLLCHVGEIESPNLLVCVQGRERERGGGGGEGGTDAVIATPPNSSCLVCVSSLFPPNSSCTHFVSVNLPIGENGARSRLSIRMLSRSA